MDSVSGRLSGPTPNLNGSSTRSICRYFSSRGECFYGDSCAYLHSNPPSRSNSISGTSSKNHVESLTESQQSGFHSNGQSNDHPPYTWNPGVRNAPNPSSNNPTGMQPSLTNGRNSMIPSNRRQGPPDHMGDRRGGNGMNHGSGHASMNQPGSHQPVMSYHHVQIPVPAATYFMSEDIRYEHLGRQRIMLTMANPDLYPTLPMSIGGGCYTDLCPLEENVSGDKSSTFPYVTSVFKALELKSGEIVTLRRVHNFVAPKNAIRSVVPVIESWKKVVHSGIVTLRHVFTSDDFGDTSLIFVYDYHPGAGTLQLQYFANNNPVPCSSIAQPSVSSSFNGCSNDPSTQVVAVPNRPYSQQPTQKFIPESLIWSYVIQLSSALRYIHSLNLACRSFDPSKIILLNGLLNDPKFVTNQQLQNQLFQQPRLRLSCCGMFDVLLHESHLRDLQGASPQSLVQQYQQDDLSALGRVVLALACNSLQVVKREHWPAAIEHVAKNYSHDLKSLITHLIYSKSGGGSNGQSQVKSINDIMPMIGGRFYSQLEMTHQKYDIMDKQLAKEFDSGRLFRLLSKICSIVERPGHRMDPQWAETGDRYLLKLFRDYLFHQPSPVDGSPFLDFGHIIACLNKLDISSPEKICLISRDEQNVLIVSYDELKRCFDSSFNDLFM